MIIDAVMKQVEVTNELGTGLYAVMVEAGSTSTHGAVVHSFSVLKVNLSF